MPTFALMTKLRPETLKSPTSRRAMGKAWLEKVKTVCPEVRWTGHYAVLGPYDFMDLYEAPDVESAHKVSLISLAEGALSAESWQILPYDRFLKVLEEVEPDAGKRGKGKDRKKDKGKKGKKKRK